jgi:hypothetical protein
LCGKESKKVKTYFPNKVIATKEYYIKKETKEAEKAKAKKARKIQRAANAFKNKQLKKEKEAQ